MIENSLVRCTCACMRMHSTLQASCTGLQLIVVSLIVLAFFSTYFTLCPRFVKKLCMITINFVYCIEITKRLHFVLCMVFVSLTYKVLFRSDLNIGLVLKTTTIDDSLEWAGPVKAYDLWLSLQKSKGKS